jgi:phospholipid/cholesterol/gamma-HCH transport system substrate-binding protein
MQNSVVETLIGAAVLAVAVAFLVFAYSGTGFGGTSGYEVSAKFGRVDGVAVGADVRISGIKVGTVSRMDLDPMDYSAVTYLTIRDDVHLPDDSSVRITSEGILGGQYVSIEPGGSPDMIGPGGQIEYTQGSIDLIGLLGRTMFGSGGQGGETPAPATAAPAPATELPPSP